MELEQAASIGNASAQVNTYFGETGHSVSCHYMSISCFSGQRKVSTYPGTVLYTERESGKKIQYGTIVNKWLGISELEDFGCLTAGEAIQTHQVTPCFIYLLCVCDTHNTMSREQI